MESEAAGKGCVCVGVGVTVGTNHSVLCVPAGTMASLRVLQIVDSFSIFF